MPLPFAFAFLTWRESVVGMKPTESIQLDIRRSWDEAPVSSSGTNLGRTLGGSVQSETLGYVRWRMKDDVLFQKSLLLLHSEGYDKRAMAKTEEDVWTDADGHLVRQRETRTTAAGRKVGDAAFYPDRIELTRTDERGKSEFAEMHPADGMDAVQARFQPMRGDRKTFLRLDAVKGSFVKVVVERVGRFKGVWGGDAYDGLAYRFTVDGHEQTAMLTAQDEIVQIAFSKETALVLASPTASRRKPAFNVPLSPERRLRVP